MRRSPLAWLVGKLIRKRWLSKPAFNMCILSYVFLGTRPAKILPSVFRFRRPGIFESTWYKSGAWTRITRSVRQRSLLSIDSLPSVRDQGLNPEAPAVDVIVVVRMGTATLSRITGLIWFGCPILHETFSECSSRAMISITAVKNGASNLRVSMLELFTVLSFEVFDKSSPFSAKP